MNTKINTKVSNRSRSIILFLSIVLVQMTLVVGCYMVFMGEDRIKVFAEPKKENIVSDNGINSLLSDEESLKTILRIKQEEVKLQQQETERAITLSSRSENVAYPERRKPATKKDDLMSFKPITAEQMNYIIDSFADYKNVNLPFEGKGEVFIEASRLTGYNPVYLFAHASLESGYGLSNLATTRHNYYGIAAFDHNPNKAYNMGDSVDEGIINGAIWIKENFYDLGQISLYDMIHMYPNHSYSSTKDKWIGDILWIMNKFPIK